MYHRERTKDRQFPLVESSFRRVPDWRAAPPQSHCRSPRRLHGTFIMYNRKRYTRQKLTTEEHSLAVRHAVSCIFPIIFEHLVLVKSTTLYPKGSKKRSRRIRLFSCLSEECKSSCNVC